MPVGMRDGPFGPYMDYVPPGQSGGDNFFSFSRASAPSGPSRVPMPSPPSANSARLDPLPNFNTASTSSSGPDLFTSTNPTWGSDSAFKWDFKSSYDIHRAGPQPRGGAVFKEEQFIPATLILNASTGASYTTSFGSEIRLKHDFLGKVESDLVSLQPGEISIEYDGDWFYGKLAQAPTGDHIIYGRDVDITTIGRSWKDYVESPDGKTFVAEVKPFNPIALGIEGDTKVKWDNKYVTGKVWINKDHLVRGRVDKTTWGQWFGEIGYALGIR